MGGYSKRGYILVDKDTLVRSKEWILKQIRNSVSVEVIQPLPGATSSLVYDVVVDGTAYVFRLYTKEEWNKAEPDLALHEARSLKIAENVTIETPRLIAVDETGKYCGYPAVLMTRVPGCVQLFPKHRNIWLSQLAQTLHEIHSIGSVDFKWSYYPYHDIATLQAPMWSRQVDLWKKVIEYTRSYKSEDEKPIFIHRDYHPVNVLWDGEKVSGVVDWTNACLGSRGVDVGHCRLNLALLYGVEIADQFLVDYENVAGDSFSYQPYWDLRMTFEFLPGPPTVYRGWLDVGVTGLTGQLIEDRYEKYMLSVWNRL